MAAVSPSPAQLPPGYRKRRPLPALVLIVVLGMVAGFVWVSVLQDSDERPGCGPATPSAAGASASAAPRGDRLARNALDRVPPIPPQLVRLQVLNGNGMRGEAGVVNSKLRDLGFVPAAEPANDPLHPGFDLTCFGEIRFGAAGEAAARTLSLVVPCAELVRDVRPDNVVDLSLGTEFTEIAPSPAARRVLDQLTRLGAPAPPAPPQGGQAAEPVAPTVDPEALREARSATC